jgi:hypothetical protein
LPRLTPFYTMRGQHRGSSLQIWGRTGFDGDMSGLWPHAELDELVNQIHKHNCEQQPRTSSLIPCYALHGIAHFPCFERHDVG